MDKRLFQSLWWLGLCHLIDYFFKDDLSTCHIVLMEFYSWRVCLLGMDGRWSAPLIVLIHNNINYIKYSQLDLLQFYKKIQSNELKHLTVESEHFSIIFSFGFETIILTFKATAPPKKKCHWIVKFHVISNKSLIKF